MNEPKRAPNIEDSLHEWVCGIRRDRMSEIEREIETGKPSPYSFYRSVEQERGPLKFGGYTPPEMKAAIAERNEEMREGFIIGLITELDASLNERLLFLSIQESKNAGKEGKESIRWDALSCYEDVCEYRNGLLDELQRTRLFDKLDHKTLAGNSTPALDWIVNALGADKVQKLLLEHKLVLKPEEKPDFLMKGPEFVSLFREALEQGQISRKTLEYSITLFGKAPTYDQIRMAGKDRKKKN